MTHSIIDDVTVKLLTTCGNVLYSFIWLLNIWLEYVVEIYFFINETKKTNKNISSEQYRLINHQHKNCRRFRQFCILTGNSLGYYNHACRKQERVSAPELSVNGFSETNYFVEFSIFLLSIFSHIYAALKCFQLLN